jgi:hypothetical protein
MKNLRLFLAVTAVVVAGTWAVAFAGGKGGHAQGSAAAYGATSARAASDSDCPYVNGKCVKTGAAGACPKGASAVAAAKRSGTTGGAAAAVHGDCDACRDWAACDREMDAAGATTQIVPLKNGVMYVYTADKPARVRVVQAALARRHERMNAMTASGDKARLCPECRALRGAAVSGKLVREVINIEGGCITLLTSNDPAIVARLHGQAGVSNPARLKG